MQGEGQHQKQASHGNPRQGGRTAKQAAEAAKAVGSEADSVEPPEALVEETTEGCFSTSDRQALHRDHLTSVTDPTTTIGRFCRSWNQHCQPLAWTRAAAEILATLNRQTTSATEHQGDQRPIWPEGFDPRAAGFPFVDPYGGNLALQD